MNDKILEQLTRIADALELAILPNTSQAYADLVKERLGVDVLVKSEQSQAEQPKEVEQAKEVEQVKESYSHDDLKALCLSKSREDVENKVKLKALLKEYGAVKVTDVNSSDLAVVIGRIQSGDF